MYRMLVELGKKIGDIGMGFSIIGCYDKSS